MRVWTTVILSLVACFAAGAAERDIESIILTRCMECHAGDRKGGLDLRSDASVLRGGKSGAVVSPGEPGKSLLYRHVSEGEMPPDAPLPREEVEAFAAWIARGAVYAEGAIDPFAATTEKRAGYDWWSLQPVRRPAPPVLPSTAPDAWRANPVDAFVFEGLKDAGLEASEAAVPSILLRRAAFDLTGLPPSPEDLEAFLAACEEECGTRDKVGEVAYAALLERLLASPHYGERWGRHWLDVVRFGESTGLEQNYIIDTLWPFRDYVIESFNKDKPFDRFVLEHLAGDALAPGDPEVEIGLAFLVSGAHDTVNNQDPVQAAQIRANKVDEMIRATSEAFLGMTVGCARCHDHKFDPILQRDYYQLYAAFAGVKHGERPILTEEAKAARLALLDPLEDEKKRIEMEKRALEKAVLERAETKLAEHEAQWPRPPVARTGTEERFAPVLARYLRLVSEGRDTDPYALSGHRIDEFEVYAVGAKARNVAAAANGGKARGKSRIAEDFAGAYGADLCIDGEFGVCWHALDRSLSIEFAKPERIERVYFSSDRIAARGSHGHATFLAEYRIEVSLDAETWTEVANSHDRRPVNEKHRRKRLLDAEYTPEEEARLAALDKAIAEAGKRIAQVPAPRQYWVGKQSQPEGGFTILLGGDPQRPGEEVVPASIKAVSTPDNTYQLAADAAEGERRIRLAEWIVNASNPLTARVLVNRLWHYHFGTGLVATPSDFGFMGRKPSHPELLDWLASELLSPAWGLEGHVQEDQAWRLKRMHKLIMLSQAYRQASRYRADAAAIDAEARLLWRFPPRRLSAEAVRDSMLSAAGKLDPEMGGPGFRVYKYIRDNVATYIPLDTHGEETYRRAVYHQNARASRMDLLTEFDSPDCALAAPRRVRTTSPLQALTLMNHSFTMDMAEALAQRLRAEAPDAREQVARAFLLCFARRPEVAETEAALVLIKSHGLRAFCRGLLNVNEFVYLN